MSLAWAMACCASLALAQSEEPPKRADWDAGAGLLLHLAPEYSGGDRYTLRAMPALYLRWGRFSISSAGGFIDRRNDEVVRGLGIDLGRSEHFRVNLGLRYDGGRSESRSDALSGLGDVKSTVRARLAATWRPDPSWRFGAAWTMDIFGRGGGNYGEISSVRESRLDRSTTWAAGATLTLAGDRYLQTWYGVNAEQSSRSGLPVHVPGNGLRDLTLHASLRHRFAGSWVALLGGSATELLGPAKDSPLTRKAGSFALQAGLFREF